MAPKLLEVVAVVWQRGDSQSASRHCLHFTACNRILHYYPCSAVLSPLHCFHLQSHSALLPHHPPHCKFSPFYIKHRIIASVLSSLHCLLSHSAVCTTLLAIIVSTSLLAIAFCTSHCPIILLSTSSDLSQILPLLHILKNSIYIYILSIVRRTVNISPFLRCVMF